MTRLRMLCLFALLIIGLVPLLAYLVLLIITGIDRRFTDVAIALDRAGNVATGGWWWETISGRSGRKWPRMARFVNWLFMDPAHCADAMTADREKLNRAKEG